MSARVLDRRTVLRGAGGAGIALPLLDAMVTLGGFLPGRRAQAATCPSPKRLVIIFSPNGHVPETWRCQVGASPNEFSLSPYLKPLEPVKDRSLFLEGVPNASGNDRRRTAVGHPLGCGSALTGSWNGSGTMYGGSGYKSGPPFHESLDNLVARTVGKSDPFPAYYLDAYQSPTNLNNRPFYAQGAPLAKFITPVFNPDVAFKQVFSGFTPPKPGVAPAPDPVVVAKVAERRSVLANVMEDFRALRCRLGPADRARLDAHLTEVGELEKRIVATLVVPTAPPGSGCRVPAINSAGLNNTYLTAYNSPDIAKIVRIHLDIAAAMLGCNRTRVIGFQFWAGGAQSVAPSWLGQGVHHNISHLEGSDPRGKLTVLGAWFAEQIMYLVTKLKAMPEGSCSVFDNTVILWASDFGNGWTHEGSWRETSWTLIGDGGGHFKAGRYLKFGGDSQYAHNRLLLSLAQYMGVNTDTFGAPEYCQGGALPGLTA